MPSHPQDDNTSLVEHAERVRLEEIRQRAYDTWDRNHRPEGEELRFWMMAERELKAERANRGETRDLDPSDA